MLKGEGKIEADDPFLFVARFTQRVREENE